MKIDQQVAQWVQLGGPSRWLDSLRWAEKVIAPWWLGPDISYHREGTAVAAIAVYVVAQRANRAPTEISRAEVAALLPGWHPGPQAEELLGTALTGLGHDLADLTSQDPVVRFWREWLLPPARNINPTGEIHSAVYDGANNAWRALLHDPDRDHTWAEAVTWAAGLVGWYRMHRPDDWDGQRQELSFLEIVSVVLALRLRAAMIRKVLWVQELGFADLLSIGGDAGTLEELVCAAPPVSEHLGAQVIAGLQLVVRPESPQAQAVFAGQATATVFPLFASMVVQTVRVHEQDWRETSPFASEPALRRPGRLGDRREQMLEGARLYQELIARRQMEREA